MIGIQADGSAMYTISALWSYAREQATRPQTLGYALTDSPVGQLAWIVGRDEKLVSHHARQLKAAGLAQTKVIWSQLGSGQPMNDALLCYCRAGFEPDGLPRLASIRVDASVRSRVIRLRKLSYSAANRRYLSRCSSNCRCVSPGPSFDGALSLLGASAPVGASSAPARPVGSFSP